MLKSLPILTTRTSAKQLLLPFNGTTHDDCNRTERELFFGIKIYVPTDYCSLQAVCRPVTDKFKAVGHQTLSTSAGRDIFLIAVRHACDGTPLYDNTLRFMTATSCASIRKHLLRDNADFAADFAADFVADSRSHMSTAKQIDRSRTTIAGL
jgi:hypothetical protein